MNDAELRKSIYKPDVIDAAEKVYKKIRDLETERDKLRTALRNLLDAVEKYTYGSLGEVEDAAREALGDE